MKKFILLLVIFICSASTCNRKVETIKQQTMVEYADTLSRAGLDSLFIADTLSSDLENDWINLTLLNDSKDRLLYKYVFMKEMTDSTGIIYTLYSYRDTLYIINKRINR